MTSSNKFSFRNVSFEVLVISGLFLLSIGIFAALAHEVVGEKEDWFDTKVFTVISSHSTPPLIKIFECVTIFGSPWALLPAYVMLIVYLVRRNQRQEAIDAAIIGVSSTLVMLVLKNVYKRNRPQFPLLDSLSNYSFPSGHAVSSFIFCSLIIVLVWKSALNKTWKWIIAVLLIAFSLLIGISRIVLRYHFASDVIAGFCLGFAWVLLSWRLQKEMRARRKNK